MNYDVVYTDHITGRVKGQKRCPWCLDCEVAWSEL
jgi:hypothetical protein